MNPILHWFLALAIAIIGIYLIIGFGLMSILLFMRVKGNNSVGSYAHIILNVWRWPILLGR
jgi:hypothetical protein